jgi:hypothetical protein
LVLDEEYAERGQLQIASGRASDNAVLIDAGELQIANCKLQIVNWPQAADRAVA